MSENKIVNVNFGGKNCEILPFEEPMSPAMMPNYKKMSVQPSQKSEISALCQQIPNLMAADTMKNAYILKCPEGLPRNAELVKFRDREAYMFMFRDPDTKKFLAHGELYSAATEAALSYGFSAMAYVTCQHYLTEINQQMKMINQGIDKILEFLYGDKKAELLSEISFARYAYQNFASMMEHPEQRIATIQSLQEARKTAIKDVEFYLQDLYSTVYGKDDSDVEALVGKAFRIRECLELSIQLFVTCNVLEVFYSQNYDQTYLKYVEGDAAVYISKCEKQILESFAMLRAKVDGFKAKLPGKKVAKEPLLEKIDAAVEYLRVGEESRLRKELHKALYSTERASEYCITSDGDVYLKRA